MSRMGDLHIDIVTDLSTISPQFVKALDCACNDCKLYIMGEINKQFKLVADTWAAAHPLRLVKG